MSLKPKIDDIAERDAARAEGHADGYQEGLQCGIYEGRKLILIDMIAVASWPVRGWLKAYAERENSKKRAY